MWPLSDDRPLFEVTSAAANAAARRITTAAYVAATMSAPPANSILEAYIDEISAKAPQFCGLANDGINPPTFAAETCRATWFVADRVRGPKLLLPWRMPITISSVVENGITLTAGDDYRLLPGAALLRLSSDATYYWSTEKIVVTFAAGWATLSANAPIDLQAAVAEQVKYRAWAINRDPALRSESEPDVYSASYAVAGGDNIGKSGLLVQVESALRPYCAITV